MSRASRILTAWLIYRFMRDLKHLKKMADYSSCDSSNLNELLSSIHPDFCAYTYTLINNHVDRDTLRRVILEETLEEFGISNSVHRKRVMEALKGKGKATVKNQHCSNNTTLHSGIWRDSNL